MNFSAKIKLRKPVRADGTCQVLLQVIIGKTIWPHSLKLGWPPQLFDEELGRCLTTLPPAQRGPDYKSVLETATAEAGGTPQRLDKRARDHNLLIGQALAKANEVAVMWRLSQQALTLERFKQDFSTAGSKDDFLAYFKTKVTERYRKGKITQTTKKNHFSTYNALVAFCPNLPFNALTTDFAGDFDRYLKKHVRGANTRWGRYKDVRAYLALAKRERIKFEAPTPTSKTRRRPASGGRCARLSWRHSKPTTSCARRAPRTGGC